MPRTHHLEPLRQRLILAIAGVVAAIGLIYAAFALWLLGGFGLELIDLLVAFGPCLLLLAAALAIVRAALGIRLDLSVTGITLHLPGAVVETAWEDVESIGPAALGFLSGEALLLRTPARMRRASWFGLFEPAGIDRVIPLSPFALPFRGSRLEADLRARLPQVFEGATHAK